MAAVKAHRLSDGTTISIKVQTDLSGTAHYTEVPSRRRQGCTFLRIGHHMYLVIHGDMVRITTPKYVYAASVREGAAKALAFCVDSAETVIAEAAKDGLPVEDYYATDGVS